MITQQIITIPTFNVNIQIDHLKTTFHILNTLLTYKYIHFKTISMCPRSIARGLGKLHQQVAWQQASWARHQHLSERNCSRARIVTARGMGTAFAPEMTGTATWVCGTRKPCTGRTPLPARSGRRSLVPCCNIGTPAVGRFPGIGHQRECWSRPTGAASMSRTLQTASQCKPSPHPQQGNTGLNAVAWTAKADTKSRKDGENSALNCKRVSLHCLCGTQQYNRKESFRDMTQKGLVGTWRLIRDWSHLLTFRVSLKKLARTEHSKWMQGVLQRTVYQWGRNFIKWIHAEENVT